MPLSIATFQETPNPNAMKCVLERRDRDGVLAAGTRSGPPARSFFDAASARDDPIASRLFAIEGVRNVLIHADWITVGKDPETPWARIKREVERVLREVD